MSKGLWIIVLILLQSSCKVRSSSDASATMNETSTDQSFTMKVKDEKGKFIQYPNGGFLYSELVVRSNRPDHRLNIDLNDDHRSVGDGITVFVKMNDKTALLKPIAVEPLHNTSSPWLQLTSEIDQDGKVIVAELQYSTTGDVIIFNYVAAGLAAPKNMLNTSVARYKQGNFSESGCAHHALLDEQCRGAKESFCNSKETPCLWDHIHSCCF